MQDKAREVLEKGKEAISCCKESDSAPEGDKPAA
jgi:hypothetical protein